MEVLFILVRIALSSKCEYYDMNLGPQTKGKISWHPFLLLALNWINIPAKHSHWLSGGGRPFPGHAATLSLTICWLVTWLVFLVTKATILNRQACKVWNVDTDTYKVIVLISTGIAVCELCTFSIDWWVVCWYLTLNSCCVGRGCVVPESHLCFLFVQLIVFGMEMEYPYSESWNPAPMTRSDARIPM